MSLIATGEFRQYYHAYYRVENKSIYYPDFWQAVGREFGTEWEAFQYLAEKFLTRGMPYKALSGSLSHSHTRRIDD
jgi:hypothetical protein